MTRKFSRDLMRGSLDLMVLSVLSEGPKYGYLLQKRLREASHNLVRIEAGTMYPLLHRLESDQVIRSRWDHSTNRPRKWYELTAAGERRLQEQALEWKEYASCIQQLLAALLDPPPEPA